MNENDVFLIGVRFAPHRRHIIRMRDLYRDRPKREEVPGAKMRERVDAWLRENREFISPTKEIEEGGLEGGEHVMKKRGVWKEKAERGRRGKEGREEERREKKGTEKRERKERGVKVNEKKKGVEEKKGRAKKSEKKEMKKKTSERRKEEREGERERVVRVIRVANANVEPK